MCVPVHVRVCCVFLALNEPWAQRCALISDPPQIFHFSLGYTETVQQMRLPVINHEYVLVTDTTSQKSGLQVLNLTV